MDLNGHEYDYVLKLTGLEKWRNVKASHLSFGLRNRGDISRAMLGKPELLLLDEFFSGLDIETSEVLVQHLKKMNRQSMIISSHSPEYIHSLCDRAVYLRGGLIEKEEWLHNEEK